MVYEDTEDFLWDLITDEVKGPMTSIDIVEAIEADMPIFIDKVGPLANQVFDELLSWMGDYVKDPDSFEDISIYDFFDNAGGGDIVDDFFSLVMQRYL